MRQSFFFLAPAVAFLVTSSGGMPAAYAAGSHAGVGASASHGHESSAARSAIAAGRGFAALADGIAAIAEAGSDDTDGDDGPEGAWSADEGGDAPHYANDHSDPTTFHTVPASLSKPPPEPKHPFDPQKAYSAVDGVDLGMCKATGLVAGYGRVVLGFATNGGPASVSVEMPAGSPASAKSCVEDAFRKVQVAPFDGDSIATARRAFFVKA
jgi:hypothetical protein